MPGQCQVFLVMHSVQPACWFPMHIRECAPFVDTTSVKQIIHFLHQPFRGEDFLYTHTPKGQGEGWSGALISLLD
jgi:hypothetical protein